VTRRTFFAILLGFALLHVVLAMSLPLSGDEAYYWDCSRHVDWSYFDQPAVVIWSMVPFRAVLGECRLAVRAPAILASLVIGLCLLPLTRRLGGEVHHAAAAYGLLHGMPIFLIGSFYASTDVAMVAAYVAATWAAVAIAQGFRRAWWGFGLSIGAGFMAKFTAVIAVAAVLAALRTREARRDLLTPTPWLAALAAMVCTIPVWVWGLQHEWQNIAFQLSGRHEGGGGIGLGYVGEFIGANLLLATPFLGVGLAIAWWKSRVRQDAAWFVFRVAIAAPLVFFCLIALKNRVGGHWGGPALVLATLALALTDFRGRRVLAGAGVGFGLALSITTLSIVRQPERFMEMNWSYKGRPMRISTDKLSAILGNREVTEEAARRLRPGEFVASESYTNVHLLAFLSGGALPTRLAAVGAGSHGLASLYWYDPDDLRGRDVLFVTNRDGLEANLEPLFDEVVEEVPLEITRRDEVVRVFRFYRCRNLHTPEGAFTRLKPADA